MFLGLTTKMYKKMPHNTPMGHWLADVHLAVIALAFTFSFHEGKCSRKPPNAQGH